MAEMDDSCTLRPSDRIDFRMLQPAVRPSGRLQRTESDTDAPVSDLMIQRVLDGEASYDDLNGDEQGVVRTRWMEAARSGTQ